MNCIECGNCEHQFYRKDALCENWRDPKRKFICPACKKGLKQLTTKELLTNRQFLLILLPAGFIAPFGGAFFSALGRLATWPVFLIALAIFIVLIVILFSYLKKFQKPIKLNAYD